MVGRTQSTFGVTGFIPENPNVISSCVAKLRMESSVVKMLLHVLVSSL
jgi:hypothetical protein